MLVHLYGQVGPLEELSRLCSDRGIHLLEDCAQAHGAKASGRPAGTWGAFAGWSFYPTKTLGCIGDGGAITTEDHQLAERARMLRNYGQSVRYQHPVPGLQGLAAGPLERVELEGPRAGELRELGVGAAAQVRRVAVRRGRVFCGVGTACGHTPGFHTPPGSS